MAYKVLVVDDTVLFRKLVSDLVTSFPDFELVGTAPTGDIALKKIAQNRVDLVLCDIYMPQKDGVETLIEIRERFPEILVVMMSSVSTRNADITIRALELGALEFIKKPEGATAADSAVELRADLERVLRLVTIKLNHRQPHDTMPSLPPVKAAVLVKSPARLPAHFSIVAIGVSTGGPEALGKLIPMLPANLPVPVVVVQHMPPGFTRSLAESLGRKSQVRVVEGEEGMPLIPGTVYIAPGGQHMILREVHGAAVLGLNDGPPENSCKPSVDVLFRSVANEYRDKGILSIVLTGMGNDGCSGVRTMKRNGNCYCITQAAATCVVYGMPRAVEEAGLSDRSLSIGEIGTEVCLRLTK